LREISLVLNKLSEVYKIAALKNKRNIEIQTEPIRRAMSVT
jgi:hypothetical protein